MEKVFEKKRSSRGITLIALVITIIVLLILAGVSIVTLTGNNGILTQAGKSKQETRGASVEEAIELWKTNQKIDNYTEDGTAQTLEELVDDLVNQNLLTEDEKDKILGNESKGIEATNQVTIGGKPIIFRTLAEKISATNYGDYINYNVDLNDDGDTTNDWRIFYKDNNGNVFIIAADYLPNSKLPPATDMATHPDYPYAAYWPGESNLRREGSSAISSNVANKYMLSWKNTYPTSTNDNIKAVAALLDTDAWSRFARGINGAEAIGTPTLEMFVKSWNEKGYTSLYCNNSTSEGYYVGTTDRPTNTVELISKIDSNGYADTLYYPHTSVIDNCYSYWLASPCAFNGKNKNVMTLNCNSALGSLSYSYSVSGVRPLVCLPSTVGGIQDENRVWTIQ